MNRANRVGLGIAFLLFVLVIWVGVACLARVREQIIHPVPTPADIPRPED